MRIPLESISHSAGFRSLNPFLSDQWFRDYPIRNRSEKKILREPKRKKSKRPKSGEKLPEEDKSRVADLVNKVLNGYSFHGPETLLQKILTVCALKPSLDLGLCGEGQKPVFAGDGTLLETGASHLLEKGLLMQRTRSLLLFLSKAVHQPAQLLTGDGTAIMNAGSTDTRCTSLLQRTVSMTCRFYYS